MSRSNTPSSGVSDSTSPSPRIAAVVLAGGSGSRFRASAEADRAPGTAYSSKLEHKLLADFRGAPMVSWAIKAAHGASFERLYVVSGAVDLAEVAAPSSAGTAVLLENLDWSSGQATSLSLAVDTASSDGFDAVVVGLGDQPLVSTEAWKLVASGAGPIAVATFAGKRRPPVKLEKSIWSELPRTGDEGARNLLRLRPELVSEIPCLDNPVDIDTIEDLDQWN